MSAAKKVPIKALKNWKTKNLKWVCAFANGHGGRLRIDCLKTDAEPAQLARDIANKIQSEFGFTVQTRILPDNPQTVEINVPPSPVAIAYKGCYYQLRGKELEALTGSALEDLLESKRQAKWESRPADAFTIADIDKDALSEFKERAMRAGHLREKMLDASNKAFLQGLHLLNGKSTNAAMLLFSEDPARWQLGAYIRIGRFDKDGKLLFEDQIHGPILQQIDKTLDMVQSKYLKTKPGNDGGRDFVIPIEAFREALVNAVGHKLYESGVPIQICVYPDRVYIGNYAKLPDGWSPLAAKQLHASNPPNPTLANALYAVGLMPGWGSGLRSMDDICKKRRIAMPEYYVQFGEISVRLAAEAQRKNADAHPIVEHKNIAPAHSATRKLDEKAPSPAQEEKLDLSQQRSTEDVKALPARSGDQRSSSSSKGASNAALPPKGTQTKRKTTRSSEKTDQADKKSASALEPEGLAQHILEQLREDPACTTMKLAQILGVNPKTVSTALSRLKKKGLLERVGSRSKGYWKVQT